MNLQQLTTIVLALASRLPATWYGPHNPAVETSDARRDRVAVIAEADATEALLAPGRALPMALAVAVLWHEESGGYDPRIHAGQKHPFWTQDNGRARCLGQFHMSLIVPREVWVGTAGTDLESTRNCARATIRVWRAQASRCSALDVWDEASVAKVFGAYARGGSCVPDARDKKRAAMWAEAMRRAQ